MRSHSTSPRVFARSLAAVALVAGAFTIAAATSSSADSGGVRIRMEDRCDPASFNAALFPGACVGGGDVTFAEFLARLNPDDGGHHAWKFDSSELGVKVGTSLHIVNLGGENHSFTEVSQYGGGTFDDRLNAALPPGTPIATPVPSAPLNMVPPGGSLTVTGLTAGVHRFQCMIHPWMRTTVTVKNS